MMTPYSKGSNKVTFTIQESIQTTNIHVKWKPGQMAISARVLCHCWKLVFSSGLDGVSAPPKMIFTAAINVLGDQRAPYMVLC